MIEKIHAQKNHLSFINIVLDIFFNKVRDMMMDKVVNDSTGESVLIEGMIRSVNGTAIFISDIGTLSIPTILQSKVHFDEPLTNSELDLLKYYDGLESMEIIEHKKLLDMYKNDNTVLMHHDKRFYPKDFALYYDDSSGLFLRFHGNYDKNKEEIEAFILDYDIKMSYNHVMSTEVHVAKMNAIKMAYQSSVDELCYSLIGRQVKMNYHPYYEFTVETVNIGMAHDMDYSTLFGVKSNGVKYSAFYKDIKLLPINYNGE